MSDFKTGDLVVIPEDLRAWFHSVQKHTHCDRPLPGNSGEIGTLVAAEEEEGTPRSMRMWKVVFAGRVLDAVEAALEKVA